MAAHKAGSVSRTHQGNLFAIPYIGPLDRNVEYIHNHQTTADLTIRHMLPKQNKKNRREKMQIPNPTNQQNRSIHHKIKALVTSGVESNKPDEMARLVETNHKEEEEEKTVK